MAIKEKGWVYEHFSANEHSSFRAERSEVQTGRQNRSSRLPVVFGDYGIYYAINPHSWATGGNQHVL